MLLCTETEVSLAHAYSQKQDNSVSRLDIKIPQELVKQSDIIISLSTVQLNNGFVSDTNCLVKSVKRDAQFNKRLHLSKNNCI